MSPKLNGREGEHSDQPLQCHPALIRKPTDSIRGRPAGRVPAPRSQFNQGDGAQLSFGGELRCTSFSFQPHFSYPAPEII